MITITTNNDSIYFLLEKANMLFPDFTIDHVIVFEVEDDFHVAFYTAANRNFTCFSAAGFVQDKNILPDLLSAVQEYPAHSISAEKLDDAIRIIENKIHSKDNDRFYFDAH